MFEGTDLSMAYGFDGGNDYGMSQAAPSYKASLQQMAAPQQPSPQFIPPPAVQDSKPPVKQMVSVQQPGDLPYQPPEAMYTQQKPIMQERDSFLERLSSRKTDILKVVSFALIILLAISLDRIFTHYLSLYISQSILTTTQEVLVRVSYPIAIILVIWFMKAM